MHDLKAEKSAKVKKNRRKKEKKEPRDWKKIFRRILRVSVTLGSIALVTAGGLLAGRVLFESQYFQIVDIRVEDHQRVGREEILALSDIRLGTNIFELDLETIGRKIEENSWIASARVQRVFPQEVVIRVTEREPRAIVNLGYLYYLDATGEVFKVLEPQDRLDFPAVTGIDRNFLMENAPEAKRLMGQAMARLERVEERNLFGVKELSEIHIHPAEGFTLYTFVGGVPIRMGFGDFDCKLDRLEHIYPELQARLPLLRYIDLNVADRVIVKVDKKNVRLKS